MSTLPKDSKLILASNIYHSYKRNKKLVIHTPMTKSVYLSQKYQAQVYLKRQDMQQIRSFKIRGAGCAFANLTAQQKQRGVVTASAGNHAQGIAYCCKQLKIKGTIFMPTITPKLKLNKVRDHGGQWLDIILTGITFDDAVAEARKFQERTNSVFIHAFDNINVIQGQAGLAAEILQDWEQDNLDYVFTCVGGGGLCSGLASYFYQMSPSTKLVGFQPLGSPSMYNSLKKGEPVNLTQLDTFCDGASMKQTGPIPFGILKEVNQRVQLVPEGLVAKMMIQIYDTQAIVVEPAGILSVAGLEICKEEIKGKNVICILSGSNNDISRLRQIRLRCRLYENKQAYYGVSSTTLINVRVLVQQIINPEQEDIICLSTAKSYSPSGGQILLGLQFYKPENKRTFEQRVLKSNYLIKQLRVDDPLLKILV